MYVTINTCDRLEGCVRRQPGDGRAAFGLWRSQVSMQMSSSATSLLALLQCGSEVPGYVRCALAANLRGLAPTPACFRQ